jgi:endonuclease III
VELNINRLKRSPLYSEELGIELKKNNDDEFFKWFLASILFGARISETIAKNTYRTFEKYNLLELQKILDAGWDFLVNPIMREGGYVRYDFKTSTKILIICETLIKEYDGSLIKLHDNSKNEKDLENRLLNFYGIGPVTVNIFLRELRSYWKKANPEPLLIVKEIARKLEIDLNKYTRKSLVFTRIEAGLFRLRKYVLRQQKKRG